jgi:predicted Zn-dependent peptidase
VGKKIRAGLPAEVISERLDNGLEIRLMVKKGFAEKYAVFTTKYGSIDNRFVPPRSKQETEVPDGIAHFLEHKLFEKENGTVFDAFAELGTYVNAYTNFMSTAYLFSCTDNFAPSLELLLDFVQEPYFSDATVEKEKGIIEQEIRMYDDNPNWKVYFNLLAGLYHRHPVQINIAGTAESVRSITKDMLYTCYQTFYHPSNMAVIIVGDLNPAEVIDRIKSNQSRREYSKQPPIDRVFPAEPASVAEKLVAAAAPVPRSLFFLGFKDGRPEPDRTAFLRREMSTRVLLEMVFGKSSDLYNSLYRDGLLDAELYSEFEVHTSYGHSIVGGESAKPEAVRDRIFAALTELRRSGIKAEAFDLAKRKLMGTMLKLFDSPEKLASEMVGSFHKGIEFADYLPVLAATDQDTVMERLAEHLREENVTVSIVSPQ